MYIDTSLVTDRGKYAGIRCMGVLKGADSTINAILRTTVLFGKKNNFEFSHQKAR